MHLGKKLIGCKGGDFSPDNDIKRYFNIVKRKNFLTDEMITKEIKLEDINDVFSDMKKNILLGKCLINLKEEY